MTDEEWTIQSDSSLGKVAGAHYDMETADGPVETISVLESVVKREALPRAAAYCVGNALKYLLRAGNKPGESWKDDIAKAENYLHRALTGVWLKLK